MKMSNWYDHRLKKNMLWSKIKAVATIYECPMSDDLEEYAKMVYEAYSQRMDEAIKCFDDLLQQARIIKNR